MIHDPYNMCMRGNILHSYGALCVPAAWKPFSAFSTSKLARASPLSMATPATPGSQKR